MTLTNNDISFIALSNPCNVYLDKRMHNFAWITFLVIRLGQRKALGGLDDQCRGVLPTLRGAEAQSTSKWLQYLGHLALATDTTHCTLLHHVPRPNQPFACQWVFSGEKCLWFTSTNAQYINAILKWEKSKMLTTKLVAI